ncbi:hypothetical protein [Flavobacterium hercynium]|uniref:Uncharacterized protein n=1 Tax=Flavobacterium hercynium TaxID=387094 RepID=A0A226H3U5_9FLAO|nr:hypothetical protein [Flavobacterium hercynium]OXA88989.1 hypothetical protein B0A66_14720 [Flavobacterium hercynium]SMP28110.1 hypothetical protein SAMN06265346_11126 [Flavobacterium hercynium]
MRSLIYFLLFSTVAFSQNYQYSLDVAAGKPSGAKIAAGGVNNQLEEIEYFKAYLLPIAQKATIQAAINKYGSVRLEKGDYTGVDIVMKSNQRLYGYPSLTKVSNITIAAGSSGVVLENLLPQDKTITLQAGGVISNCTIKSIKWATLMATNATFENNTFINYGGRIIIDCSKSGYFRNNKFIKHQSGGVTTVLTMKGNSTTPSYGNVHLHTNFLTPHGDTSDLNNLASVNFVGIDAEGWNLKGTGTKAMFKTTNMGNIKITDFGGGNSYSAVKTGAYDIDAANVSILNKKLYTGSDVIATRTNVIMVAALGGYKRTSGTVTGFDLWGNLDKTNSVKYNSAEQSAAMSSTTTASKLSSAILGTKYKPWSRPSWETLPDPMGANWKTDRVGKPDSTTYIQNLINKSGIAELPEGIFYINSTLKIPLDSKHGIVGKGTGKTVIVGLKDNFPLITLTGGQDANFVLAHLTLQGGSKGIYSSQNFGTQHMAYVWLKYVVFRDQSNGIHLDKMKGFDNNFLDNISFVNCSKGFFQEPLVGGVSDNSSFVDKTMFYRSQFINCNTGVSMLATRPDNLDAWVDCKFSGGQTALHLAENNYPIAANCDFTGFTGKHIIISGDISLYSSNLYNNSVTVSTIKATKSYIEGSTFSDASSLFSSVKYNTVNAYILNSTVTGNMTTLKTDIDYNSKYSGVFMNNTFKANSSLSKQLVNIKEGTATVIINTDSNPYPQLLVTQ